MAEGDGFIGWLARFLLVVLFPFSALDKILHWNTAMKQANSSILPANVGAAMLITAMVVEFICPLCILLYRWDRFAAFILAGFCVVTAVLYHPFWKYPSLFEANPGPSLSHFWDFLKNLGLAGGLMFVVFGARLRQS
jgi:putative oxidoreductase